MVHLGGTEFPTSAEQLRAGLADTFGKLFTLPDPGRVVAVEGGVYPAVDTFRIDLSGVQVDPRRRPPKAVGVGQRAPGITAARLELRARPARVQGAPIQLQVEARDVRFDFDRDQQGRPVLVLADAKDGRLEVEVTRQSLEALILAGAREQARSQGITVEQVQLGVTARGPRSLSLDLRVRARKGFFGATIRIRGRLDINDELVARASGLSCEGEGFIGGIACGAITPHLQRFEGREIPLMALSLGDVRFRDLQIAVNDAIKVTAAFGS